MLHRNASPEALGAGRVCVYGVWLVLVVVTPVQWHAELPHELFEPWGPLRALPEAVYEAALTPGFLIGFKTILIALLGLLVLGVRPFTPLAILAFAMLLFHDGLMKAWQGTLNHAQGAVLYAALVLPLFPAADGLSVLGRRDRLSTPGRHARAEVYAAGLLAVALVLCFTYSFIGIRRIAFGGTEIFTGDALLASLALRSVEYGPYDFDYGLLPLTVPWLAVATKVGFLVVTVFEVLSPLVLISRRFRYAWLAVIVPFHFATLFTMNIFFWENLVLILIFLTGAGRQLPPQRAEASMPARRKPTAYNIPLKAEQPLRRPAARG